MHLGFPIFHQKTWNAMWVMALVLTFQLPPRSPLSEVRAEVYNQHGDILLSNLITTNSPFQEQDGIQIVTRRCNKANSRLLESSDGWHKFHTLEKSDEALS